MDAVPWGRNGKPPWKKVVAWLGATIIAGLAVIVTGAMQATAAWVFGLFQDQGAVSVTPTLTLGSKTCDGGSGWVFPVPPERLSMPPEGFGRQESWAAENGGIQASSVKVDILVLNRGGGDAVVTAVKPIDVKTSPPIRGTHGYRLDGCGGGPVDAVQMAINLDALTASRAGEPVGSDGKAIFPRNVPQGSPDDYELTFQANSQNYSFDIEVDWRGPDNAGSVVLNNNGRHYEIATAAFSAHANGAFGDTWRISDQDPFMNP